MFAASGTGLAVGAHRLAGGDTPTATVVIVTAVLLAGLAWTLTGAERRGWLIAALVGLTQTGAHLAFMPPSNPTPLAARVGSVRDWALLLFCHHGSSPIPTATIDAARAALGLPPLPTSGMSGSAMTGHAMSWGQSNSWAMLLAHLAAAAVMAWWLRRGERAAWRTLQRVGQALARHVRAWPNFGADAHQPTNAPIVATVTRLCGHLAALSHPRRGPPALFA